MGQLTKLYHTTGEKNLPSIRLYGLKPTAGWSSVDAIHSGGRWVYLAADALQSKAYGVYFKGQSAVLLEIDLSRLDKSLLGPDDMDLPDLLDQNGDERSWNELDWRESLKISGQATYDGTIPWKAIKVKGVWEG